MGVHPAGVVDYVIGLPRAPTSKGGLSGAPPFAGANLGGTGSAKAGGNYAASLLPQIQAEAKGLLPGLLPGHLRGKYRGAGRHEHVHVMADGTIRTPELGVILEGGTRSAILRMLRDQGGGAREDRPVRGRGRYRSGAVAEVFACGTAAAVTPGSRAWLGDDFDVERSRWGEDS